MNKNEKSPKRALWAKRDLNPRHPACKAGALDQLSYSPLKKRYEDRAFLGKDKSILKENHAQCTSSIRFKEGIPDRSHRSTPALNVIICIGHCAH